MPEKYGVTPQGFMLKRLDAILDEINGDLKAGWGFDTSVNPQSAISVLTTSFGDQLAGLWELGQDIYNSMYPSSAEGVNLDNAMQFGGVTRLQKARTIYSLCCTGGDGTEIPHGSLVRSTTQPVKQFQCARLQSISRDNFRAIRLRCAPGSDITVYTIAINNGTYVYEPREGDTEEAILAGLRAAITDESFRLELSDVDIGGQRATELVISAINHQSSNVLVLSDNLMVTECSSNIVFESVEVGKVIVPSNTITEIVTITTDWNTVTNDISPVAGRLTETDTEARQSYIQRIAIRSRSMLDSIRAAIYNNVQGVSAVECYENETDTVDAAGLMPHSVEIVVDGGDDGEIAQEIFAAKANGIQTNGRMAVDVADDSGNIHTIRFNRPEYLYIWLRIELVRNPGEAIPPNYAGRTKEAVVSLGARYIVGENVFTQMFLSEIYRNVTGVSYVTIRAFATTSPTAVPVEYPLENIETGPRQRAVFSAKRIEVTLVGH